MDSASACRLRTDVAYWQHAAVMAARNLQYHLRTDIDNKTEAPVFFIRPGLLFYSTFTATLAGFNPLDLAVRTASPPFSPACTITVSIPEKACIRGS